jgi:hypothetical protein
MILTARTPNFWNAALHSDKHLYYIYVIDLLLPSFSQNPSPTQAIEEEDPRTWANRKNKLDNVFRHID